MVSTGLSHNAASATGQRGFTLIELLVVMAVLGLLLALVAPRYTQHVDRAREVALQQSLFGMREAIDKFYADHARYPVDLQELVKEHYLRQMPVDPITERGDAWVLVPVADGAASGVRDVRSGAPGLSKNGTAYGNW
jgi:general secretion pathway protein G